MKDKVRELREFTAAPISACYKALKETGGNIQEAIKKLQIEGAAAARLREGKPTKEGIIASYTHFSNKLGVLMEINCETESLARTQEFQLLAHDILLQIAASKPLYIKEDDVPEEHIKETKEIFYKQAEKEGKPEHIRQRITEGKLKSYLKEICLLSQPFIKDPSITIQDYINQFISKAKEKVVIKRFVRFELGKEERFG